MPLHEQKPAVHVLYLKRSFNGDSPVVIILILILRHKHTSQLLPQQTSLRAKNVAVCAGFGLGGEE